MIDDLISRGAVLEKLLSIKEHIEKSVPHVDVDSYEAGEVDGLYTALVIVQTAATVPAVHVDKLNEWFRKTLDSVMKDSLSEYAKNKKED